MKAAIDLGSNTVLLLVGRTNGTKVTVLYEEQHTPRLGRGVDREQNLHPDSVARALNVLEQFRAKLDSDYTEVNEVYAVATSAVRDAGNRSEFLQKVKQRTGWEVQVASGEEEAAYTFAGAQSVLNRINGAIAVIDIGGGSTEIATGRAETMSDRCSFDVGSVRFTERYLSCDPPTREELDACRRAVRKAFEERAFEWDRSTTLIGVAGTVTSLAAIANGTNGYNPEVLNGTTLSRRQVTSWISDFSNCSAEELLVRYPNLLKGRSDVFLGGLLVLEGFMDLYGVEELLVSTGGIRHGALVAASQKKGTA